jgi:transposase, IS30 family
MERTDRHLTFEERRTLFRLLNAKLPVDTIAAQLGRHRSTLYREIARNEFREVKEYRGYYPLTAEDSARRRRRRQRKLVKDGSLREHIVEKLALCWSPEQIAGRLKLAGEEARLCHETIYQFVYSPDGRALELHRHLLRARRLRRRRFGRKPRSLKIPLARTIAQRPTEVGRRQVIGHWEADLLIFQRAHGKANLTSLVERKSRLLRLVANADRQSRDVIGAIGEALRPLPATARHGRPSPSIVARSSSAMSSWPGATASTATSAIRMHPGRKAPSRTPTADGAATCRVSSIRPVSPWPSCRQSRIG